MASELIRKSAPTVTFAAIPKGILLISTKLEGNTSAEPTFEFAEETPIKPVPAVT